MNINKKKITVNQLALIEFPCCDVTFPIEQALLMNSCACCQTAISESIKQNIVTNYIKLEQKRIRRRTSIQLKIKEHWSLASLREVWNSTQSRKLKQKLKNTKKANQTTVLSKTITKEYIQKVLYK